jgi:hypothetical protein
VAAEFASKMSLFLNASRMLHSIGLRCRGIAATDRAQHRRRSCGVAMENRGGCTGVGFWGFGSMLAVTLSWGVHHSILWMMLHGMLSWLYVIYYSIKR